MLLLVKTPMLLGVEKTSSLKEKHCDWFVRCTSWCYSEVGEN